MSRQHFDFIQTSKDGTDRIRTGYCICKKCGQRVETGIINLSEHWSKCYKEEYEEIIKTINV